MKDEDGWRDFWENGWKPGESDQYGPFFVPVFEFPKMTKRFGRHYIEYLIAAWHGVCECMTEEEFLSYSGNVPRNFFETKIKPLPKGWTVSTFAVNLKGC